MRKQRQSFTLIEVMVVSFIVAIALIAVLQVHVTTLALNVQSKEITLITDDLKDILEKIGCTAFSKILTDFPNNCCEGANCGVAPGCPGAVGMAGQFILNDEKITVTYPLGTNTDPLAIQVQATWTGRDKNTHTQVFKSSRTKGL